MRKWFVGVVAVALVAMSGQGVALADSSAAELPPTWHIHDGQLALGPQHKGIAFFPTILGISEEAYRADPASWARCPNAVDKAFLPSFGKSNSDVLRVGVCMTSTTVIHLRTVPTGTAGPAGWQSLTTASEPGFITYYLVTPR
jgi:hypothetical protein